MTTSVLVDSNIFLDVFTGGLESSWSAEALAEAGRDASLGVNPVIWSEISTRFATESDLAEALSGLPLEKYTIPYEAAFLAGKVHLAYRRAGGARERTLPDFLIGAHAAIGGHRLLTRDAARYRSYFPSIEIISPETHS